MRRGTFKIRNGKYNCPDLEQAPMLCDGLIVHLSIFLPIILRIFQVTDIGVPPAFQGLVLVDFYICLFAFVPTDILF